MKAKKLPKGFTLIEMIVSVGLFAIVMVVVSGAYLSLINLERKARALSDLMTNLSFVTDTMVRTIRAGTEYEIVTNGSDCNSLTGQDCFRFLDEQGNYVTYIIDADGSGNTAVGVCVQSNRGTCNSSKVTSLTDPRVKNLSMNITVRGVVGGDNRQPFMTFTLSGNITPDPRSAPIPFVIQSAATQRLLDL